MRLNRLQSLDNYIFDAMHDCLKVDANFVEEVFKLREVPFRGILSIIIFSLLFTAIGSRVLDVILIFLVHRVVGQMNEPLVNIFLTICVFLCSEASQPLLEQVDLEWVKSGDECIYAQIILEAIYQVWVAHIL